ncbi:MAG: type II toxin-antitoxin system VapC family toxin [Actinomycetota bacterium]|nr:type II toxin-antitoxin system VapC family toxin [Actinomycetota bacterium]
MPDRGLLDTSVLIAETVRPLPGQLAISVISVAELHYGVLVAAAPDVRALRLARLSRLQRRFDPLPVDDAVADSYGQIAAHVAASGRRPRARTMDLLIAATAHVHGAILYTRNAEDFRGLETFIEVAVA